MLRTRITRVDYDAIDLTYTQHQILDEYNIITSSTTEVDMAKKQHPLIEVSNLLTKALDINEQLVKDGLPSLSLTDYDNIVRASRHLKNKLTRLQRDQDDTN